LAVSKSFTPRHRAFISPNAIVIGACGK
jgi:hypothetical protein